MGQRSKTTVDQTKEDNFSKRDTFVRLVVPGELFRKAFLEEWVFVGGDSSDDQNVVDFLVLHSTDHADCIPEIPRPSRQFDSLPWEPSRPQGKAIFWKRTEAPLPPLRPRPKCNFIHPRQFNPFPERLELPFSNDEILCGYEDIVSSGTDHFTAWDKVSPHEVLVQHMVAIHIDTADFREASERRPAASSHTNRVNKHFATRSLAQKKFSVYNWNSGTGSDAEKKMPSRNNLQAGGTSLPCRRRPNMSIMTFLRVAST